MMMSNNTPNNVYQLKILISEAESLRQQLYEITIDTSVPNWKALVNTLHNVHESIDKTIDNLKYLRGLIIE